eukprot:CAMPEP_0114543882 /NCGR_PEP_ID=MMETSP0114-20121206/2588_1 /TAXON_ID=31324 /ORGANISM="Goniomonas sp, Strain m" /LENGTH=249 /DNA_ID=CAMNT_0001728241 /DNA_START=437 /DNA_END=1186 /DNA_ORIENTATION=+
MVPYLLGFNYVVGAYWTLQTEIGFYICCAFLCHKGVLGNPRLLSVLVVCLLGMYNVGSFIVKETRIGIGGNEYNFVLHLSIMFWGCLLRLNDIDQSPASDNRSSTRTLSFVIRGFVLYFFVLLAAALLFGDVVEFPEPLEHLAAYAVGVAGFWLGNTLKWNSSVLAWVGKRSYSVYLFHPASVFFVRKLAQLTSVLEVVPAPVWIVPVLVVALGVSHLSFTHVEMPGVAVGRRLASLLRHSDGDAGRVV